MKQKKPDDNNSELTGKTADSNKVLISFSTVEAKIIVLRNSKNLKDDEEFKSVYMNHDRTIAEMQRDYEMRQECRTKNMKLTPEDQYYFDVRANSVVKLKKQQQPEDISVKVSREITFLEEIELIIN